VHHALAVVRHPRRILELEMNTGERFQNSGVPRDIAVMLVKAKSPAAFLKEAIDAREIHLQQSTDSQEVLFVNGH